MPSSREASSTARRNEPSCCVSAARKGLPNAIPLSSSLFPVANRCERSRTIVASPSASPALGGRGAQAPSRLKDLVVLADLDPVTLRRREGLLPRRLLGARGLELGLVPPRHRVPNVRLVVDGEMAFAASVDVRELPSVQLLAVLGVELCHRVAPFHGRTLHNSDPPRTGARARRGTKQAAG